MHPFSEQERRKGMDLYGLDPAKKHILITGGSLGSGTLNNAVKAWISNGCPGGEGLEILWQCGSWYKSGVDAFMAEHKTEGIHHFDFIKSMDLAFAAADLVISRSGASSVSEICATGKPAIFVPSPNVAEDHQTHNAMALVSKGAALMVKDSEAAVSLLKMATESVRDDALLESLSKAALSLARLDAAQTIVDEIYRIAK